MSKLLLAVCGVVIAAADDARSLEEAYGPVTAVNELKSWAQRKGGRSFQSGRDEGYWTSREECSFSVELVLVQDMTLHQTVQDVQNELPSIYDKLQAIHKDSKIGVTSFIDKPKYPYGDLTGAYCYKFEQPLTNNLDAVNSMYYDLLRRGSDKRGDIYNSQFDALAHTISDSRVTWSQPAQPPVRLVVLATTTPPHFALDGLNIYGMPAYSSPNQNCANQYYPDVKNILSSVTEAETYVMVAVMPGLTQPLAYLNYYWLTAYLGFTANFVTVIDGRTTTLSTAVSSALEVIQKAECSLTTIPPTTTPQPPTTTTIPIPTSPQTTIPEPTNVPTSSQIIISTPLIPESTTPAPTTVAPTTTTTTTSSPPVFSSPFTTTTTPAPTTVAPTTTTTTTSSPPVFSSPFTTTTTPATTDESTVVILPITTAPVSSSFASPTMATITAPPDQTKTTLPVESTAVILPVTTLPEVLPTSTVEHEHCHCAGECGCECNEVVIRLKEKPKKLELSVINE